MKSVSFLIGILIFFVRCISPNLAKGLIVSMCIWIWYSLNNVLVAFGIRNSVDVQKDSYFKISKSISYLMAGG